MNPDIFSYIKSQEALYKLPVQLNDKWNWSMKDHLDRSFQYINSQLYSTTKTDLTPVKNITLPILNLQHRTEDIEAKEVQIYVDDPEKYHLSFLVKKYHDDIFVQENDMDTFFDDLNISRIDYGAGLSKQLDKPCPEVVPLQSIAFCDQTDILSGPIGIKHFYSPDQLLDMAKVGWGSKEHGANATIEETILLSREEKQESNGTTITKTPGRYIEVYEVHGNLPKIYADKNADPLEYETRMFIVCFYKAKGSMTEQGIILFTEPETKSPFKLIKRDPIYGRALGRGGAEEIFDPQIWTNYDMVRIQQMLDSASKTILQTTDPMVAQRNKINDLENNEILTLQEGTTISQVDTFPRNMKLFDNSMVMWESQAQTMGAANDAIMGKSPAAGSPFALQELVVNTNQGLHTYRRMQYAKHLEEIYRDWIIPHIQKKITEGAKFLSELSLEDLQYVTDCVVTAKANEKIVNMVLAGETPTKEQIDIFKQLVRDEFKKKGNKHFIEIIKGEFKDAPLAVKVTVAGKSTDLADRTQKLVNVFRQIIANPAVLTIPPIGKIFNDILEASGLDPADFSGITKEQIAATQPQVAPEQPQISPMQPQMTPTTYA